MLDRIEGEWETREIYLAGGRLNPSESLAVARHSAHEFGCDTAGVGRRTDRARAVAARHRSGERRRSLPGVQVGGDCAPAADGLRVGARHGPRRERLSRQIDSVVPPRATMRRRARAIWRTRVVRIDLMSDLHVEGWASQWRSGSGEQQAAWSAFRPDGPPADVAVIAGGFANSIERSAAVILEAATHWPEVVVVDGTHEYYDTAEGGLRQIWRRLVPRQRLGRCIE